MILGDLPPTPHNTVIPTYKMTYFFIYQYPPIFMVLPEQHLDPICHTRHWIWVYAQGSCKQLAPPLSCFRSQFSSEEITNFKDQFMNT